MRQRTRRSSSVSSPPPHGPSAQRDGMSGRNVWRQKTVKIINVRQTIHSMLQNIGSKGLTEKNGKNTKHPVEMSYGTNFKNT